MLRSLALLLLLSAPLFAQLPPPRPVPAPPADLPLDLLVDRVARAHLEKQQLVGLAVGVVVDGRIFYAQGYGFADWEAKRAVDPYLTTFRWASCSKPVTAVAAMQLVEAGKLDLEKDVREYVPEFPDKKAAITAKHLLAHQGGIVHYTNGKVVRTERKYDAEHPFDDVVVALDTFKESPLVNPPGAKFAYTTHGYILLSAVVQRAGGERFEDQVAKRIAAPLGMKSFRPDREWEPIPGRAVGYMKADEKIVRRPDEKAPDVSWKLGGGGYTSNIVDLAKFATGLVNGKVLSPKTLSRMWTDHNAGKLPKDFRGGYGLGFHIGQTAGGQKYVGHGGSQEKTKTYLMLHPETRRAVVVMSNSEWANPQAVAAAVSDAVNQAVSGKSPVRPSE